MSITSIINGKRVYSGNYAIVNTSFIQLKYLRIVYLGLAPRGTGFGTDQTTSSKKPE